MTDQSSELQQERSLPHIVGIGASAGGLHALGDFFSAIPHDSGAAFVVVQHLSPDYTRPMEELLRRHTTMNVTPILDSIRLAPNTIFWLPPGKNVALHGNQLCLTEQDSEPHKPLPHCPIDFFFHSLAVSSHIQRTVVMILSGTGSDGAKGMQQVADAGGIALVQDPTTAEFDGMPHSAIATGAVDLVLAPTDLAITTHELVTSPDYWQVLKDVQANLIGSSPSQQVGKQLKPHLNLDVAHHKPNTITHPIKRRCLRLGHLNVQDYVNLLEQSDEEREILQNDLLIRVTQAERAVSLLLDRETTAVLMDIDYQLLYICGDPLQLLSLSPGRASLHIMDMVPDDLQRPLATALTHARQGDELIHYQECRIPRPSLGTMAPHATINSSADILAADPWANGEEGQAETIQKIQAIVTDPDPGSEPDLETVSEPDERDGATPDDDAVRLIIKVRFQKRPKDGEPFYLVMFSLQEPPIPSPPPLDLMEISVDKVQPGQQLKPTLNNIQANAQARVEDLETTHEEPQATNQKLMAQSIGHAIEIEQARTQLQKSNEVLEAEVAKRTKELAQRAMDLELSNAELEQFAYAVSHDLQEPLRAMTMFSELLKQQHQDRLDSSGKSYLNHIIEGGMRLQAMIDGILAFSRIGYQEPPDTAIDLETVLLHSLDDLQSAIQSSSATITHDPLPTIFVNAHQFHQLFQNLIGNAIKFKGQAPPQIHISVQAHDNQWLFSVQDNGIGIPLEQKDRIFALFQRLHTRDQADGYGIGLALCKKIIQYHGGRIWLDSELGRGTTFFFTITKQ